LKEEIEKEYFGPFVLYSMESKEIIKNFEGGIEELISGSKILIIYIDHTNTYPSNLLKNLIYALSLEIKEAGVFSFVSLRDKIGKIGENVELQDSIYFQIKICPNDAHIV
jgi:hypothetical protein